MAKKTKKEFTEFTAGDKVKLVDKPAKKQPVRIGGRPAGKIFFAAVFNGLNGALRYGQVYQVSGRDKVKLVDNTAKPLPLIDKEFINHPRFNGLFKAVKSPDKTNENEDKE